MDDAFVQRFMKPWNDHDVDGAMALMTDDRLWEVSRGCDVMTPRDEKVAAKRSYRKVAE